MAYKLLYWHPLISLHGAEWNMIVIDHSLFSWCFLFCRVFTCDLMPSLLELCWCKVWGEGRWHWWGEGRGGEGWFEVSHLSWSGAGVLNLEGEEGGGVKTVWNGVNDPKCWVLGVPELGGLDLSLLPVAAPPSWPWTGDHWLLVGYYSCPSSVQKKSDYWKSESLIDHFKKWNNEKSNISISQLVCQTQCLSVLCIVLL